MKLKMRGKYGWDQKGSHNLLVIIYWVNTSFLRMWANPSIKEPTENLRIAQKGHADNTYHLSGGSKSERSPEWVMLPQTWPCEGLQCPAPQLWTSLSQLRLSGMADSGGLSENSNRVCKKINTIAFSCNQIFTSWRLLPYKERLLLPRLGWLLDSATHHKTCLLDPSVCSNSIPLSNCT